MAGEAPHNLTCPIPIKPQSIPKKKHRRHLPLLFSRTALGSKALVKMKRAREGECAPLVELGQMHAKLAQL